jgi:hypothetical protein
MKKPNFRAEVRKFVGAELQEDELLDIFGFSP